MFVMTPAGDTAAPAVWFAYSPDRRGEHPEQHVREFRGTLQADAYAGYQITRVGALEAGCGLTFGASFMICNRRTLRP